MENKKLHKLNQKMILLSAIILGIALIFLAYDISIDIFYHSGWQHTVLELLIFTFLVICIFLINLTLNRNENMLYESLLGKDFEILTLQERNYKISTAIKLNISKQFLDWTLTESECEIGFLLIKGFSNKEIAALRSTEEKTIRDQSSSIYHKAKIRGRSELSAFFLEDLL